MKQQEGTSKDLLPPLVKSCPLYPERDAVIRDHLHAEDKKRLIA